MSLASGHKSPLLEGEEYERVSKFSPMMKSGLVRLSPGNWLLPAMYLKFADRIYNFKAKPSDVYINTYAKVGTTWTQEIIWTMKYNPNLDHPDQTLPILDRSPFLDADMMFPNDVPPEMKEAFEPFLKGFFKLCPGGDPKEGAQLQLAAAVPEPRVIKCHLPLSLMSPSLLEDAKVVYVARNPKDVVCSYHHHLRLFHGELKFSGSLDDFCELFMSDSLVYSPYWLHVKEAWEKRHHPNMHFMLYEDMKDDIMKELKKLDQFLGTNLTEEQLENVKNHTSFSEMKKRDNLIAKIGDKPSPMMDQEVLKADGGFFRQGKTGEGNKKLSPEMLTRMNEWSKTHFNFGLDFD